MHMIAGVLQYVAVASFAEAWIETSSCLRTSGAGAAVASFAEAWIETCIVPLISSLISSPPSRRRGLKLLLLPYKT